MGNCIAYIVNKNIEEQGSEDRSLRNTGENYKKARKEHQKHGLETSCWIGNCETSLHNHRKAKNL
jgi:hypothetical protein